MLKRLIDYRKLDHQLASLLLETYPYGYGDEDIVVFKNQHGEIVEAVELRTDDTLYLVKISKSLSNFIANFEESIGNELEDNAIETEVDTDLRPNPEMEINFETESSDYSEVD